MLPQNFTYAILLPCCVTVVPAFSGVLYGAQRLLAENLTLFFAFRSGMLIYIVEIYDLPLTADKVLPR